LLQETGSEANSEYRFWHPLTQEVAYGSLLADRRRRLHAAVAGALADLDPARNDERAALIASHYAGAGADLDHARWEERAAGWSQRRDFSDAVERWRNVLTILAGLAESDETIRLGVRVRAQLLRTGARIGLPADETDRYFAEAEALEQRLPDPPFRAPLYIGRGAQQFIRGEIGNARLSYEEATRLASETVDTALTVTTSAGAVYLQCVTARPDALSYLDGIEEKCRGDFDLGARHVGCSPLIGVMRYRGELLALGGRLTEARAESERALDLARERAQTEIVPWVLADLARLAELTGEAGDDAADRAAAAVAATDDSGNIFVQVIAHHAVGVAELVTGRPEGAEAALIRALARARTHGAGLFQEGYLLAHLAAARLAKGDPGSARRCADEALEVSRRQGAPMVECFCLLTRARVLRAFGAEAHAHMLADVEAGSALAADLGAVTYGAFLVEERARLLDDHDGLREALRRYQQIGATGHARRLEAERSPRAIR